MPRDKNDALPRWDCLPIRVVTEYRLPPLCCACGEPAGPARFKVYASAWNRRHPYAAYFPLCPDCERAYSAVDNRRRLGCWAGVGLAFLAVVGGIVGPALLAGGPWGGVAFVLFWGAILLGSTAYLVIPLLFAAPARAAYRQVVRAVRIKDYSPGGTAGPGTMVLCFAHRHFAADFRALNEHLVIGD